MSKMKSLILARLCLALSILLGGYCVAHEGHGSPQPWVACEQKKKHEACAFSNSRGDIYKGTCKSFSGELMCVRNQPIEYAEDRTELGVSSSLNKALNSQAKSEHKHD